VGNGQVLEISKNWGKRVLEVVCFRLLLFRLWKKGKTEANDLAQREERYRKKIRAWRREGRGGLWIWRAERKVRYYCGRRKLSGELAWFLESGQGV